MSPLMRFIRDFEPFLLRQMIWTTEGTLRSVLRCGLFHDHPKFEAVTPAYRGGLVQIASKVVDGTLDVVVYLVDPRDPTSTYPETGALKRECVVNQRPFLATSRSARTWAALTWGHDARYFVAPGDVNQLQALRALHSEGLALIAHDNMKVAMLEFARDNYDFLAQFGNRFGTGTTATMLNGERPQKYSLPKWRKMAEAPLAKSLNEKRQERGEIDTEFVQPMKSGPDGGDVQIANLVLDRKCSTIIFFEDPSIARQHEQDIQLLERTGRALGRNVICLHDPETAREFASLWAERSEKYTEPLLAATAIERVFKAADGSGVKAILVSTSENSDMTWDRIRTAAAWYLRTEVSFRAEAKRQLDRHLRVTVSWGIGMKEVANRLVDLEEVLAAADRRVSEARRSAGQPVLESPIREEYRLRKNLIVAPLQGLMGSTDVAAEGNAIARQIGDFFGGRHLTVPAWATLAGSREQRDRRAGIVPERVLDHWRWTDLVVTTAAHPRAKQGDKAAAPQLAEYMEQVLTASCGDMGGIYLREEGVEHTPFGFERVGMSTTELKGVQERGGDVALVIGAVAEREKVALAALRGHLVSVLITDVAFAKALLGEESRTRPKMASRVGEKSAAPGATRRARGSRHRPRSR